MLAVVLLNASAPSATASTFALQAFTRVHDAAGQTWGDIKGWFNSKRSQDSSQRRGVKPRDPESNAERESRVASLEVNPGRSVTLQSRESISFGAVPFDSEGTPVHGLRAEWESSDKQIIFVKKSGQAIAGKPGHAVVKARAGHVTETINVEVIAATNEKIRGKKKQDSTRSGQAIGTSPSGNTLPSRVARNQVSRTRRHHPMAPPMMPLRDPNDDPLPDGETSSLYSPSNIIGSPPGKTVPGAMTPASATGGTENGRKNFTFGLPIVDLPGRQINVSLRLIHNSQAFHKSTASGGATWMTYDVDSGWPATGWRLGFGQIEDQGSAGYTLVEPDGTRRSLSLVSTNTYDSTDGSFIRFVVDTYWSTLFYPDGTQITYGASGGGYRSYPTAISDRNGNYIAINYLNGVGPKISSIQDTLSRYINFYYATNGDLVTITAPGLTGQSERQVMRFYYTDVSLTTSGLFGSGINVNKPSSVHTLQYVYLASATESGTARIGYKFDYNVYGTMYQIKQFRGMTVSSTSTSSAGSVTSEGTQAAITTYDYPGSASSLTDVPMFSTRTDDWAGRTTSGSAPQHTFANSTETGAKILTVTAPDQSVRETRTIDNSGQWDDGLVKQTLIKYGSTVLSKVDIQWQQTPSGGPPRVEYVKQTDDGSTARTKGTVFTYTTYNNVSVVSERDFTTDGSLSTTELRRTETTYVTSSSYTNRRLLRLPSMVKVFPGGSSTPASRTDFAYDNYGTNHADLTARNDIIMHSPVYDPFQPEQEFCDWVCNQYDHWGIECIDWRQVCTYYNPYDPATDYRGNVTSITTYPDATTTTGAITHNTTYDIAGNVTTTQVDCCQQMSFTYSGSGGAGDYAFPISVTKGNPSGLHLTTSATFDYNTGLLATRTDENSQVISNAYNADSLRLDYTTYPDGGEDTIDYFESLSADANGEYHFYVETKTKLDNNGSGGARRDVKGQVYFDGRGAVARILNNYTAANGYRTQDIEYDNMGRAYRESNPYYASSASAAINADGFWTTRTFDRLGRITQVTMPRGDNNNSLNTTASVTYDGIFTTVTDPAGKTRRQKVDALGRVVRADEPTTSGLGTTGSPNQATDYYYDVLGNLVRVDQGSQDRYFKYDSLSRLIRERHAEQSTNSSYNLSDSLTGNSSWSRKIEYNSHSLVTNVYDARGVQTSFTYDGLNRVTQITYSDSTPTAKYFYDSQSLPSGAPSFTQNNTAGRVRGMTYGSSSATGNYFSYDSMGRVTTQKQVTGSTTYGLSYTYNAAGMLVSETYPTNRVVTYSYDESGRLASVGDGSTTFASSVTYGAHGGLTSETLGNTAVHTMTYNRRLQPDQAKMSLGSSVLQQYDYGYGTFNTGTGATDTSQNNGQIGSIKGTIGTSVQWLQGFQYDELGRLSNVAEYQSGSMGSQTYSQAYTYDRYGNRFQSANATLGLPAITSSEITATTNRFINSGSTPTTYDASGNITQDTKFRGMTYTYDANGRQTSGSNGSISQSSTYDCLGQKVRTTVTVSSTNSYRTLVYDVFGQLVADYNGSSGSVLESEYVYRGGKLLARYNAPTSSWNYVMTDVQGSARALISNNGGSSTVTARHDYLPFGEEIASGVGLRSSGQGYGATNYNRLRYGLMEREDVLGLDHSWWRKYEQRSGRWTSPDPYPGSMAVNDPQSFNRYAYTGNDPVNFVDPSGLQRMCWGGFYLGDGVYAPQICFDFPEFDPFVPREPNVPTEPDPQDPAPTQQKPDAEACDKKLAALFGGEGAVADTGLTPGTLNHPTAGMQRFTDHSAAGGVMHLYSNAQGTAPPNSVGLYVPQGFSAVPGGSGTVYNPEGTVNAGEVNYNYSQYRNSAGVTISFVHIGPPVGPARNAAGSTRVGSIAGPGGDGAGYNHTHINFYSNFAKGERADPRKLFCKEFGF